MANQEQLKIILEEGVEAWNNWRQENQDIKPNLRGANLKGANLSGADFSNTDIRGTIFKNAILEDTKFCMAKIGFANYFWFFLIIISLAVIMYAFIFDAVIVEISSAIISKKSTIPKAYTIIFLSFVLSSLNVGVILLNISKLSIQKIVFYIFFYPFLFIGGIIYLAVGTSGITNEKGIFMLIGCMVFIYTSASLTILWKITTKKIILAIIILIFQCLIIPEFMIYILANRKIIFLNFSDAITSLSIITSLLICGFMLAWYILTTEEELIGFSKFIVSSLVDRINKIFEFNGGITDFSGANLRSANFTKADFTIANFRQTNLNLVKWKDCINLEYTIGNNYIFKNSDVRNLLITSNGKDKLIISKNLSNLNLNRVNLKSAELESVNLNGASLKNANLEKANLAQVTAIGTNFKGANLTGVCIEDWKINSETILENVICDYIYLKKDKQERRPSDPKINFEPGQFTKLFQEVENTIELIFNHGINWRAFAPAFYEENMKVLEREGGEIFLREYKAIGDDLVVLNILIPPNANKEQIRQDILLEYERRIAALEGELKAQKEILAPMYERLLLPGIQMTFNSSVYGVAGNIEGNQNIFTSQSISQASSEIQNLLTALQNNGLTQEQAEEKVAKDLATQAKDNPTALGKLVNWGKSLGNKAADTSVSEVVRRVIKLALNLAGVPMP